MIAERQVPPAALRLRDHGAGPVAGVIAERQVPPAALRLRDHGTPCLGALPNSRYLFLYQVICRRAVVPERPSRGTAATTPAKWRLALAWN
jgi:hypothetical protein